MRDIIYKGIKRKFFIFSMLFLVVLFCTFVMGALNPDPRTTKVNSFNCKDTDNGVDIEKRGTITYDTISGGGCTPASIIRGISKTDRCTAGASKFDLVRKKFPDKGSYLLEYYCDNSLVKGLSIPKYKFFKCECENGKCKSNRSAEITLEQSTLTMKLSKGWNLISTPIDSVTIDEVIGTCNGKIKNFVWWINKNNNWEKGDGLDPLGGAYIYSESDCELIFKGEDHLIPISRELNTGWQIISSEKSWNEIKGNCEIKNNLIYQLNNVNGAYSWEKVPLDKPLDDSKGYFIFVLKPCKITEEE